MHIYVHSHLHVCECVCDFEWHEHMSVCSCMHLYQAYVQYYGGPNLSYESAIEVLN